MNSKTLGSGSTAVVIGAGFAGIATALRLRALGYQVTLLERLNNLGGRAQVFERGGYRHDAGPTVITAPFLFDELFELFDEKLEDYLDFVPLDPFYRFHFADGSQFDYRASIEDTLTEIRRFSPEDADGYLKLLAKSEKVYEVGFKKLAHRPFTKVTDMIKQIPALLILKCYMTVSQMVNSHLKHPLIRQAFSIHPLLVGGNPFKTTAIYTLIHYLERRWGVFFCMGGTGKLVEELGALMERQGINIVLNADVDEIVIANRQATGVRLSDNQTIGADLVVFGGDPETCYQHLLPKSKPKIKLPSIKKQYSMGLFVLYFGTRKLYPDVAHHSIWMGPRFKELLAEIFDAKQMSEDFSLYVHRPTATDKSFAPDGCESFYVLCPVPNLQGNVDWSIEAERLRDRIVDALEDTILPELSSVIEEVFWMTPEDFAKDYRSMHGAGFSIEPRLTQSAWFRFHNRDSAVSNLYFVGAGTHPGAGLPGVVSSAKVVEELLTGIEVGSGGYIMGNTKAHPRQRSARQLLAQPAPKQTLARHGKSFYWASLFLGPKLAERAAQLYQFCRFVDDLADGELPNREESLDAIRARLDGSNRSTSPEVEAFMGLATQNDIPLTAARELLDGMLKDQQPTAFHDETELLRYCHAVAGTVGLMMCRVLDCKEQRADKFAIDLGVAMQLTNISRDVLEDAKMGRRYLPASWVNLSAAEIAEADIANHQRVATAITRALDLAEDYYQSALLGIQLLPFRSRLSITIALRIYRQIGWILKRRNLPWWQGRIFVSKLEKVLLSARSVWDLKPINVPAHRKDLHQHLQGLAGV